MSVKLILVFMLVQQCLLALSQSGEEAMSVIQNHCYDKPFVELVLQRMTSHSQFEDQTNFLRLPTNNESLMYHVEIIHIPSFDLNIYLALHSSMTPNIMTSLEVSLNDAGVMNVKNLIFLRKDQ